MCNGRVYSSARCLRSQCSVYMGGFVVVGGFGSKRGGGYSPPVMGSRAVLVPLQREGMGVILAPHADDEQRL